MLNTLPWAAVSVLVSVLVSVVGSVAGHDTVLVISQTDETADALVALLEKLRTSREAR